MTKIVLDLANTPTTELLAIYNAEARIRKQPELAYWKSGKEKLADKLAKMCAENTIAKPAGIPEEDALMRIETEEEIMREVDQMPPLDNSKCIKDIACQLLTAVRCKDTKDPYKGPNGVDDYRVVGFSYASILKRINQVFPKSTTSNACLRWYLVRIRQEVEGFDKYKMPIKFKRPKSIL